MNVKGASFFQLHIEKLVLGTGVLFLVVTVAVVMLGIPWRVELGGNTYNSPKDVIPDLVTNRERLEDGLINENQIDSDYVAPDMLRNYERLDTAGVTGGSPLNNGINIPGPASSQIILDEVEALVYVQPTPPMPTNIKVFASFDVLNIEDQILANQYFALWNNQRVPADFNYVFIEGEFSNYDWMLRLLGEGQRNMIPIGIWEKKLGIAAVYLVRQELNPQTGIWENTVVVKELPLQRRVMPTDEESDLGQYPESLIAQMQASQGPIRMTPTPPLKDNYIMLTPREFDLIVNPFGDLDPELAEQAADEERRRLREEERARREEERQRNRDQRDGQNNPGGGLEGPGLPGRGGGRGRGGSSQLPSEDLPFGQDDLANLFPGQGLNSQNSGTFAQQGLERPTNDGTGRTRPGRGNVNPNEFGPGGLGNPGGNPGGIDALGDRGNDGQANADLWRVWALDVTVEPGKTYRYKLVVAVINPLYGVNGLATDQQETNQNMASLAPSTSDFDETDWTEPIVIEPTTQFFVIQASDNKVKVEVWRVHDGLRVKEEFNVSPGDPIGGIVNRGALAVNLMTGATVVDIDRRRNINGQVIFTLIYIDANGVLHERSVQEDQSSPDRRRLEQEIREQREGRMPGRPEMDDQQQPDPGFGPGLEGPGLGQPGLGDPGLGQPGRGIPGRPGRSGGRGQTPGGR